MIKKSIYLLIASLMLVSCQDSSSNLDESDGAKSYTGILRQISSDNAKSDSEVDDKIALDRIARKCGSENGGVIILSGDDSDLDGTLEYEEAYETGNISYLCNGKDGQIVKSANENDGLIKALIDDKCQGANGLAFYVGYDRDNDGELSESERSLQPSIICDNRMTTFDIKYYDFYSTLTIDDGSDAKYVNLYYPKITELDKGSLYCAEGGFRIEMFGENMNNSQPKLDFNTTICNGADGETPKISPVVPTALNDTNNSECQETGGLKITLGTQEPYYICNGGVGTFSEQLDLTIKNIDGKVYIYDTNKSKIISDALDLSVVNIASEKVIIKKQANTSCPYGELNITTYLDSNFNNSLDSTETANSTFICSAEPVSTDALNVLSALIDTSTNLSINFKFNRLVNQLTVNSDSVAFICSSDSESNKDVLINIDHKKDLTVDGVQDFNITYTKENLPQPTNDIDCILKISKFIEDVNGNSMQNSYLEDFNFTVQ